METAWGWRCSTAWELCEGGMGAARKLREGGVRAGFCSVGPLLEQCGGGVGAA